MVLEKVQAKDLDQSLAQVGLVQVQDWGWVQAEGSDQSLALVVWDQVRD